MSLVIKLWRVVSTARARRTAGRRPAAATLERIVVDGKLWAALEALGRHRLPTLADVDPYGVALLRGKAVDRMVRKLKASDLARLGIVRAIMCGAR